MAGRHRDRLRGLAGFCATRVLIPLRRPILSATAFVFVSCAVLLTLTARLPFPPPSERILYDPTDWSILIHAPMPIPQSSGSSAPTPAAALLTVGGPSVGGSATAEPPLAILLYTAKPGDTMGGIAEKLGLNIDTISSLNRVAGRGVHNIVVGETLKVPSEDGIYLSLTGDFDELCRKNSVQPDDILAANSITRSMLQPGMSLFFPGVQHKGIDLQFARGVGVSLPLHGWESSSFGRRLDPFTGLPSRHTGVDIAAAMGSPIRSGTDGVVVAARFDTMLGNYVEIRGQVGYSYVYGHMSRILIDVGTRVSRGALIGLVGETGYATGPHLHFEVRYKGVPLNPKEFLPGLR